MRSLAVAVVAALCSGGTVQAQSAAEWKGVLERLERLEKENDALRRDVRALTAELEGLRAGRAAEAPSTAAAATAEVDEKLAVQEKRIEEQAQTKVEASQRFPIRLSGMALMNTFYNTRQSGGFDLTLVAAQRPSRATGGATWRQTVLGFEYHGPTTVWGGQVRGSLYLDFFDGRTESFYSPARVRTADIEIDWGARGVMFAYQKPLIAPRDPTSLAYVGISPLTGSGNLWRWQPQIRYEERIGLGRRTVLRAQGALFQTSETVAGVPPGVEGTLAPRRPGIEGRFEVAHETDDGRRIEFAPGFHVSTSHVGAFAVPSDLWSLDWLANPWRPLEFSGTFFSGRNVAHFGGLGQAFVLLPGGRLEAVRSKGGWGQLAIRPTDRLAFHVYGGVHDDRNADLRANQIGQNRSMAANIILRVAPNVLWSIEALQIRTSYLGLGWRLQNRYDMAIAYQF